MSKSLLLSHLGDVRRSDEQVASLDLASKVEGIDFILALAFNERVA